MGIIGAKKQEVGNTAEIQEAGHGVQSSCLCLLAETEWPDCYCHCCLCNEGDLQGFPVVGRMLWMSQDSHPLVI